MDRSAWSGTCARILIGKEEAEQAFSALSEHARLIENDVVARSGLAGWCIGCGNWSWFSQPAPAEGDWANLGEGLSCACGLNSRMRMILSALDSLLLVDHTLSRAVVFEQLTALFPPLRTRLPDLVGSEYLGADCRPGESRSIAEQTVRHESMLELSYPDDSQDLVMHFDVLEHVPDAAKALAECHRVLRPGGWLLFTCPFYEGLPRTIVRARMVDGELHHDMAPCFHGNPVDGGGALVFTQPGWDLLDTIEKSGFPEPLMMLRYDPAQGILSNGCPYLDGHTWPIVFLARKPLSVMSTSPVKRLAMLFQRVFGA